MINDVSGLNFEPEMPKLIAETGARYVVMHNRGNSKTMDNLTEYTDLVTEVVAETQQILDAFLAAGVDKEQLIVDPGLGFSKSGDQNWQLLNHLEAFQGLGYPVLIGASASVSGTMLAAANGKPVEPRQRDHATAALPLRSLRRRVAVRVIRHPNLDAVKPWLLEIAG